MPPPRAETLAPLLPTAKVVFLFSAECLIAPDGGAYTREQDLLHTGRLLSGETGYDQVHDRILPAVRDIEFLQFGNLTGWSEVAPEEPGFPGGMKAMYAVSAFMTLDTADDNLCSDSIHLTVVH